MNEPASISTWPRGPVALIDLAETQAPEESRAFAIRVARLAEEAGGSVVLANKAVAPMIVPDESASSPDHATRVLLVTRYPTRDAGHAAFAGRKGWEPAFSSQRVRTYAARPAGRLPSSIGRNLPRLLGLTGRMPTPKVENSEALKALIDRALILGEQPDAPRWTRLNELAGDRPIWMMNFLEFAKTADYKGDPERADAGVISGARAYQRYGRGMVRSLGAVGGRVGWAGDAVRQLAGPDDGRWHQIAIAVYPSAAAMMTMLSLPNYRAAHVHRAAALARTRLLATQPAEGWVGRGEYGGRQGP